MNIDYLKLFLRVCRVLNISQAGNELGLSSAVASAHISKLEEEIGVKLLHRTTRKVSLTEEGKIFLPHAENVLLSVDQAKSAIGSGSITPQGTLRVTASASFGRLHMMPVINEFLNHYPALSLDLRLSDSITDLVEGGFDVAVRNAELKDSSFHARKLAPDRRIICASPDYLNRCGTPDVPQDLEDHECIQLAGLENWSFKSLTGPVTIKTHGRFRSDCGESVRDACIQGQGIAICSLWIAYQQLEQGELSQILPRFQLASNTAIWAVYPNSRLVSPKVRAFIDFFSNYYSDLPYWDKN